MPCIFLGKCLPLPHRNIEYQQVGQPVMFDPFMQGLALLLTNADITEKTETIVYTFESFLAEFGGALGLFLGFSFFSLFDTLKTWAKIYWQGHILG